MSPAARAQAPAALNDGSLGLLEAVRLALSRNPDIRVSELQLVAARGSLQEASGAFDTTLFANATRRRDYTVLTDAQLAQFPPGFPAPATQFLDTASAQVGATQVFRNGISVSPTITQTRTTDNLSRLQGLDAATVPVYAISVTVPLLRNSGRDVVAAAETVARGEVDATRGDLDRNVSQATFNVVSAYWNYVAAKNTLAIASQAESSTERRGRDVDRLIAADRVPAAQRDLVAADVAAKRTSRISAEQALTQARSSLARAIGLTAMEASAVPPAVDDYPAAGAAAEDVLNRLAALRAEALDRRGDLRAAMLRAEEARVALVALRKNLAPQLDMTFSVGSAGLREGNPASDFFSALDSRLHGPNALLSFTYQFPVQNNVAQGQLAQRIAQHDQALVREHDLREAILTDVETLAQAVRRAALQLKDARDAVTLFARSVANEETRRQLGQGTLIDVITVADRLLQARFSLNSAQLGYALAVAQLRLATGTLTRLDDTSPAHMTIDVASLTEVPR
ncbi:MAG TPA: TolC family protein [Usitatibacter sp.]|nr:TolC family protein [Usitatibacter sp.]